MEVHHHPHVEKKNFKEYFLEFLMIFLAVTMGFFAESLRENITDKEKEKEYIKSFVQNLKDDTASMANVLEENKMKIEKLQNLMLFSFKNLSDPIIRKQFYKSCNFIGYYSVFKSNDATMLQLKNSGGLKAGINETKKALTLDPLSSVINMVLGRDYYDSRNYDQAITQLQKTIHLNPKFLSAYIHLGYTFLQKKLYPQAIDVFSKVPPTTFDLGFNGTLLLSYAYSVSGDKKKAKEEFNKISKEEYPNLNPWIVAQFDISMGNFDEALTQLEYGYSVHSIGLIVLKVDPTLDPLRNEPRFKTLLKKTGLE